MAKASGAYYEEKGKMYPRVTSVAGQLDKPFLNFWYGKHGTEKCQQISKESKEIGTMLHAYADSYFAKTLTGDIPMEIRTPFSNFLKFAEKHQPEMEESETLLFGKGYAGTRDWKGTVWDDVAGRRKKVILDWKTSKDIDTDEYELQLEAYYRADPDDIEEFWIVRLPKVEGEEFEIIKLKPCKKRFKVFSYLLFIFNWRKNRKKENKKNESASNGIG